MNEQAKRIGPTVRLEMSCYNCQHCQVEHYECGNNHGQYNFCGAMHRKQIGSYLTPTWCPFHDAAIAEFEKQKGNRP